MSCVLSVIQARQSTSELGDYSVPDGWKTQTPVFNKAGDVPGAPVKWSDPEDPEDAQPGYGYVADDTASVEETYYYHSDHLGSTSYITDDKANITQYDAYLPYGELLVDEHNSSEEMTYKFNGKEMDEETGLYYYGARYMNPQASLFLGVDPLAEKYYNISPYVYCGNNPVNIMDPNGMEWVAADDSTNTPYWDATYTKDNVPKGMKYVGKDALIYDKSNGMYSIGLSNGTCRDIGKDWKGKVGTEILKDKDFEDLIAKDEKEISNGNYSLDVGTSDVMGASETTLEMCGTAVEKIGDTSAAALASKAGAAFKVAGALASCAEIGYFFIKMEYI